ncbi:two-component system OmpR family sensor kinase [Ereboglobus sp. PH5-5]|uniref:sensor histidine kinase n=1 Tax=Ereboglobus sp. PH5-5 TaxID=2940529 RepID=UPI002404CE7F|nr:ATP-binding protein [Ereboglobus sp. PH5-5]MDF9833075.1 two-component system OmpR family sensor kinase [Ereboglobus sp. PH5-5]
MASFLHSIRWRIQAWHGLILLVMIVAFCFTAWRLAWDASQRRIDRDLRATEHRLFRGLMISAFGQDTLEQSDEAATGTSDNRLRPTPADLMLRLRDKTRPVTLSPELEEYFKNTAPGYGYFVIRDHDGSILLQSQNVPGDFVFPPPPPRRTGEQAADEKLSAPEPLRTLRTRREAIRGVPEGAAILTGRDITPELAEMNRLAWKLAAAGLGIWLLGLAGGWWIAGRAIRPIRAISHTATRIAEGNLDERIDTRDAESELGQLATVLNDTFARLHASIEQQKRFTSDASHELRTPISILIAETQRILKRERTSAEYRETLQTCADTAARMRHLVEALLLLARQEAPGRNFNTQTRVSCDLADIMRDTARQLAPLAAERHIEIDTTALVPAPLSADPATLGIIATNLISNAIQHHHVAGKTGAGGHIRLKTGVSENKQACLIVEDDGPGITAEDLPHIFDRFYRADKARTHNAGQAPHIGLGLAIVRRIIENHRGTIEARSEFGRGAVFEVRLPQ